MAKTEHERIVLSRERLMEEIRQKRNAEPIVAALIGAAAGLTFLAIGLMGRGPLWICILFSLFFLACCAAALLDKRNGARRKASDLNAVRRGQMTFVKNRVTDKDATDTSSGSDPAPSMRYTLYFHKTAKEGRRSFEVNGAEYRRAAVGDEYLLLYVNERLAYIFPCDRYRLDGTLQTCLVGDQDVVGEARMSEYEQYEKLEREIGMLAKRKWLKTHTTLPSPDAERKD